MTESLAVFLAGGVAGAVIVAFSPRAWAAVRWIAAAAVFALVAYSVITSGAAQ